MIQTLRIQNFRSILDTTIDFSYAEGKAPNGYASLRRVPFFQEPNASFRGAPVLAFFGANAAGKSNLLKAVDAFRRRAIGLDPGTYPFHQPDKLHGPLRPTTMRLDFFAKGMPLRYELEADGRCILREELDADGKPVFAVNGAEAKLDPLVKPAYPLENLESFRRVECALADDGCPRRSFLAVLGRNYGGLDVRTKAAYDFFKYGMMPSVTDNLGMAGFPEDVRRLAEARGVGEEEVLADIAGIIRKLDVPIAGLSIVRTKGGTLPVPEGPPYQTWVAARDESGEQVNIHLVTLHKDADGRDVRFRLNEEESNGTQNLVYLVARLLLALERGAIVFIDELDRSLHPILLRSLLNLFVERERNPKGARLVFTTHCTDLLDDSILRVSEVGLVTNGERSGTRVKRLADLRAEGMDIRNVTDFRRNYLDGFYSGVPYPSL